MTYSLETNIKSILQECFNTDTHLIDTYHIASGAGVDECVEKTYNDLESIKERYHFYSVKHEDILVGFFGIEKLSEKMNALTGFFIKPQFRNKKQEFWTLIKTSMNNKPFLCGLYKKNTRAIKFLESLNGQLVHETTEGCLYLMENKVCR